MKYKIITIFVIVTLIVCMLVSCSVERFNKEDLVIQDKFLNDNIGRAPELAMAWHGSFANASNKAEALRKHIQSKDGQDAIRLIAAVSGVKTPKVIVQETQLSDKKAGGEYFPVSNLIVLYYPEEQGMGFSFKRVEGLWLNTLAHESGHAADRSITGSKYQLYKLGLGTFPSVLIETRAELNVLRVMKRASPKSDSGKLIPIFPGSRYYPFREPLRFLTSAQTNSLQGHKDYFKLCSELEDFQFTTDYIKEAFLVLFFLKIFNYDVEAVWEKLSTFESDKGLLDYVDAELKARDLSTKKIFHGFFDNQEKVYNPSPTFSEVKEK